MNKPELIHLGSTIEAHANAKTHTYIYIYIRKRPVFARLGEFEFE